MNPTGRKKITLITGAYPPIDAPEGDYAFHLVEHLRCEYQVSLVTGQEIKDWGIRALFQIINRIRRERPDSVFLLYLHFIYGNRFSITFLPFLLRIFLPKIKVVTLLSINRGAVPSPNRPIANKLFQKSSHYFPRLVDGEYGTLLSSSHHIVHFTRRKFEKQLQDPKLKDKLVLMPPPPILRMTEKCDKIRQKRRAELAIGPDETALLFFGYLYLGKGIETLLNAFRLVLQNRPKTKLVLFGGEVIINPYPGDNVYVRDLKALAQRLGIAHQILWLGGYETNCPRTSEVIHACDIGVLPFDEGIGFNHSSASILLNHGLPLISTSKSDTEPEFIHEQNCFLVPPKETALLAEAILEVITNFELQDSMRKGASVLCRQYFSWENCLENINLIFREKLHKLPSNATTPPSNFIFADSTSRVHESA